MTMTILPVAHPEIAGEREAAGMFVKNFGGPDVAGFLVGHVPYGITVAIAYAWLARVLRRRSRRPDPMARVGKLA